jgi:DNA-binding transcriptional regulator YdaS (Cro superfamily)
MKQTLALNKVIKKYNSMTDAANAMGMSVSYLSHLASGRRKVPIKYVKKIVELSKGEIRKKDLRPDVYDD